MALRILPVLGITLLVAGCEGVIEEEGEAASASEESAETAAVAVQSVGSLTVADQLTISFYEPAPGVVYTSEHVMAGGESLASLLPGVVLDDLRPSDYYRLLSPGTRVPAELKAVESRLAPRTPESSARVASLSPPLLNGKRSKAVGGPCDENAFRNDHCRPNGGGEVKWCHLNSTQRSRIHKNEVMWLHHVGVCAQRGSVLWQIRGGSQEFSLTLRQGETGTWTKSAGSSLFDPFVEFSVRSQVDPQTSGASFHHGGVIMLD
jgi:hypothetical protein